MFYAVCHAMSKGTQVVQGEMHIVMSESRDAFVFIRPARKSYNWTSCCIVSENLLRNRSNSATKKLAGQLNNKV